ncbi:MAG: glycosyltransferase family 39 protein [Verrucomicrobiota bacterium]|nr:glycosyltransferase family 39 protein [Verrucomicrobiota bacterium]
MKRLPEWLFFALFIVLFAVRNLPWHLDDYDQAKQAYTSFEMVEAGNWWFQHTPAQQVATKPPLAGWISALLFHATRWWDGAWRLPSFASALAILFVLARAGRRLLPNRGALVAGGAFALNVFTPRLATLVRTDMLLCLFIFGIGLLIFEKVRADAAWTARERLMVFALVLGAMMTKGPIVYAFLLPGLIAFAVFCRRQGHRFDVAMSWWPWFLPLIIFFGWVVWGLLRDGEFYNQVVLKEFLGRFSMGERAIHKNQPFYFYVTHLLLKFAPWSLLFVALLFQKNVRSSLRADPACVWLVCWVAGALLVMSVIPSKRPDRIFPIIPPLALLLVCAVRAARLPPRLFSTVIGGACLMTTGYTAWNVWFGYRTHQRALVDFGERFRAVADERGAKFSVVSGKDEGMLLYARTLRFAKLPEAINDLREQKIEAVILPLGDFEKARDELPAARVWFESQDAPKKRSRYVALSLR